MNLAHFVDYVFALKRDEAETWNKKNKQLFSDKKRISDTLFT